MRLVLLLSLLVNFFGWSQTGMITGEVTLGSKDFAVGATVFLEGTNKYTIVDGNGRFEIKGLSYGSYTLSVSSVEAVSKSIDIVINAPVITINFQLNPAGAELLEEVAILNVSAKKQILDRGFAVNVIDPAEATKRNVQVNELLDRSVGVRIRQNGGLGSSVDYNLNGMSGNSVRIFIDGIPISAYGPSFNLNSIPVAQIERIDIYKGVVPAHLADDALGGAIDVILKKGTRNFLNASVSYGSFNTVQSNANATFRAASGFTVKASAFQNYSDNDYEVWGKFVYNILPNGRYDYVRAKRFNNRYRSMGGRAEAGFTYVKWADQFFIGFNHSNDYNEIQHGQFMTRPYKGRFTESEANVFNLTYAKKNFLTKGLELTVNGVYSQRNEVVNDTVKWNYNWDGNIALGLYGDPILTPGGAQQGAPTINHIDRNILSVRSGLAYNVFKNHKVIFSNMYNMVDRNDRDEMVSALERRFLETRDLQKHVSTLAYELEAFDSRLNATVFGKYYEQNVEKRDPVLVSENGENTVVEEVFKNKTTTFGYGAAASYYLKPKLMLQASAEKAIRMPSENEVFGSPGENIIGNATINPEQSNNLNVGLKLGPYAFRNHKLSASASGFWRNTTDKIIRATSSHLNDAIQTLPYENLGKAQSLGFEAALEYVYDSRLFLSVNMSKFNSLFKMKYDSNGNVLPYYNEQLPNEPFFTLNGNAQYSFKNLLQKESQLNLYYSCGYVEPFYTLWIQVESFRTPAQFVQDLGLSYAFPGGKFVLSADAKNVFDRQIYDNFAVQKPGRAFYLKLNYTINNI